MSSAMCGVAIVIDQLFFGGVGQKNKVIASNIAVSYLNTVSVIYQTTLFGAGVGLGISLAIAKVPNRGNSDGSVEGIVTVV